MATQLNIKDPVLIERARELARRDGKPVTATLRALVDHAWSAQNEEREVARRKLRDLLVKVRRGMPPETQGLTADEIGSAMYDDDEPDGFAR